MSPRETRVMRLPDDATPPAVADLTPMQTVVGLARLEERFRAMSRRFEDFEARQEERGEALKTQLTLAFQEALKETVAPLAEDLRQVREGQLRSGTSIKTVAKIATLAAGAASFLWGVISHFWPTAPH